MEHTGAELRKLLDKLTEQELCKKMFHSRFEGEVTVWWIIVRGDLDHEIHHRGQTAAYLTVLMGQNN